MADPKGFLKNGRELPHRRPVDVRIRPGRLGRRGVARSSVTDTHCRNDQDRDRSIHRDGCFGSDRRTNGVIPISCGDRRATHGMS